jgi:hypothetical protein
MGQSVSVDSSCVSTATLWHGAGGFSLECQHNNTKCVLPQGGSLAVGCNINGQLCSYAHALLCTHHF